MFCQLMKQVCVSPVTELCDFFQEIEQDFLKKTQKNLSSYKLLLMFWCAIKSAGRKMLVMRAIKQKADGDLEILKNYEGKMHFLNIIFQ